MILQPEKSKEIRMEMAKESDPVQLYLLSGCRVDSKTGDLYVAVMLYDTPSLTKCKYRAVRKYEKKAYEPLMVAFREKMKDEPSLRGILASYRREYYMWQGYFCLLAGGKVLAELLDDFKESGVEKIEWVVYGKGGRLISAYLDRYFDLNYSIDSAEGVGAGNSKRYFRYYARPEELFAREQTAGVRDLLILISQDLDVDVRMSAYTGTDRLDETVPFYSPEVKVLCREHDADLKSKTSAVCKESNLGVWHAGKEKIG